MAEGRTHEEKDSNSAGNQAFLTLPFIESVTCQTDHPVCPPRPVPRKEPQPPAKDWKETGMQGFHLWVSLSEARLATWKQRHCTGLGLGYSRKQNYLCPFIIALGAEWAIFQL